MCEQPTIIFGLSGVTSSVGGGRRLEVDTPRLVVSRISDLARSGIDLARCRAGGLLEICYSCLVRERDL